MIYFFDAFGRITRRAEVPFSEAALNAQAGEQWVQSEEAYPDDTHYISNGAFHAFPPKPSQDYEWDWRALGWFLKAAAFEDARSRIKSAINTMRDSSRYSGVTFRSIRYDSDPVSAGNVTGWMTAITAGIPVPPGFTWRSQDNQDVPFTESDILGLAAAMVEKTTACYQRAWQLKAQVDAFTDPADYSQLQELNIDEQWPE